MWVNNIILYPRAIDFLTSSLQSMNTIIILKMPISEAITFPLPSLHFPITHAGTDWTFAFQSLVAMETIYTNGIAESVKVWFRKKGIMLFVDDLVPVFLLFW